MRRREIKRESAIKMPDGTVVLANIKPGAELTEEDKRVLAEEDKRVLAEWVQFCRDRRATEQRKRNREALPGGQRAP